MADSDGYTRVTRPYPSDAPAIVTLWNPACACGHAQAVHEYDGDEFRVSYGPCEVARCGCGAFTE